MAESKKLLIIAHAPSENTQKMLEAVINGATNPDVENVQVRSLTPLETQPDDINAASAIILGTTENLGYMAGLMKDVFDRCYYPCLDKTEGLPFAFYVRAGHDGTGTQRAIESITKGLRWRLVQDPFICRGDFQAGFIDQCEELGLAMAASLEAGII
ncbi:flavodoxin family protein [Halomonas colorata]|uniref:Flavodoxin family protein n=1 Tax=Halomonas colorata TaxID=2742615 RepID=A0ABR9FWS0_9GAMM|nr:flavodoxin family protein [Halomonas colorata]MBE0463089.1 flavodoxin family protein [Halomonas colorata]